MMNKANELREKYEADLKKLRENCKHEHISDDVLTSEFFMHFTRMARFCLECNKEFPPINNKVEYQVVPAKGISKRHLDDNK